MKLGNTSQSMIPVPNFYLTKNVLEMEVFKPNDTNQFFKEKDLFRKTKDINLSNNFRNKRKIFENYNKEKYIPIHKRNLPSLNTTRKIKEPNSKYVEEYDKYHEYLESQAIYANPKLRNELRDNINTLIERINSNFDLDKWGNMSTRPTIPQQFYSSITDYNSNNPNDSNNFNLTLKEKINHLKVDKINEKQKENLLKTYTKYTERDGSKNRGFCNTINMNAMNSLTNQKTSTSLNNRSNELSDEEKRMKIEYARVYDRFKNTTCFKDFPSPTRTEFSKKK